jgi:hypothetical protein
MKKHKHYFRLKPIYYPSDFEQKVFKEWGWKKCECGKDPDEYRDENTFLQKIYANAYDA